MTLEKSRFNVFLMSAVTASVLLTAMVMAAPMGISSPASSGLPTALAQSNDDPADHEIELTAERLANGQLAYKMVSHSIDGDDVTDRYSDEATIPGPTIVVNEGDSVVITLTNELDEGADVGMQVQSLDDSDDEAAPGDSVSYEFTADSVGTFLYNDNGSDDIGLFGAVVVNPEDGEIRALVGDEPNDISLNQLDVEYVLFMVGSTFWGAQIDSDGEQTPLWTNPTIEADQGDIVRFHVLGLGHSPIEHGHAHTFHLHAHRWLDPGTNNIIDTKTIEPQTSHVFAVEAGFEVGPGDWQYHCHVFSHMEAGMHGIFRVNEGDGDDDASTAAENESEEEQQDVAEAVSHGPHESNPGASPVDGNFATFEITDEPGRWFKSTAGSIAGTDSLAVIEAGGTAHFMMTETSTVHTITSLIFPEGAANMPFDQTMAYMGGGIVTLEDPGLYVFTCKVHPYMFGAVVADDPETEGLDLGEDISLVTGTTVPTSSDLATRLLRTFFVATNPDNWQNFASSDPWHIQYPDVDVRISGGAVVNLNDVLEDRYGQDIELADLQDPENPGIGEVWVDTQFEKTEGKSKPGTVTAVDAENWDVTRKVALPEINMNNPHNMWADHEQEVIYQTQWFDNKLTTFDRETGELIENIEVGHAPAHVMTRTDTGEVHVSLNGERGVAELPPEADEVERIIMTQEVGADPTNPHAHWMSHDGQTMVTPNAFTADSTIYDFGDDQIADRVSTGALPIATGMMPDASKYYVANLLSSTISVIDTDTGEKIKDINLLEDYDPINGLNPDDLDLNDNGRVVIGALPIQTPVSPDGKYMVTANTLSGTLTIVDTETDEAITTLFCDAGCHGVQFGAKEGGGYYAYVSSKFANDMIVVDADPNGDGDFTDAEVAGRVSLVASENTETDDEITDNEGMGGQGVLPIPVVYNGWVQELPEEWKDQLDESHLDPLGGDESTTTTTSAAATEEEDGETSADNNDTTTVATGKAANTTTTSASEEEDGQQISIRTVDSSGSEITGYYVVLSQDGEVIQEAYSPAEFDVSTGQTYEVEVADYGGYVFDRWSDENEDRSRSAEAGDSLTAIYRQQ